MTYLVDASVLVEALRPVRDVWVGRGLDSHPSLELCITAMSLAELEGGARALMPGAQRNLVTDWVRHVANRFEGRVLGFDAGCAGRCAQVRARGLAAGRPVPMIEAMICAIAERYGLILAARPTAGLALWGGPAVNPWQPMPTAPPPAAAMADAEATASATYGQTVPELAPSGLF
jgi:predicted nucleic acid-binding protein